MYFSACVLTENILDMLTFYILTVYKSWTVRNIKVFFYPKDYAQSMRTRYNTNEAYFLSPDCFWGFSVKCHFYLFLFTHLISSPSFLLLLCSLPIQLKKVKDIPTKWTTIHALFFFSRYTIRLNLFTVIWAQKLTHSIQYWDCCILEPKSYHIVPSILVLWIFDLLAIYPIAFLILFWIQIMITFEWKYLPNYFDKKY